MRFRRLKLSGFKSFVEPAELRIEPGLTGVVGPNGCGKSNLLEAIRWVMGESSARSLRGGGMDDVIFAGTARRPPRDFAEVALLTEDADGAEIEVVRRIERGAGSAYRVNGRDARARDVSLIFADAATGAHSPALVSQGRIAAVIAAKPAERRLMLEDAAGISGLHARRKDAETRLRATEANVERLRDTLAALQVQIAALSRQARAAERYRALSDAIRLAEARTVFARWRDAADAAAKARDFADAAVRDVRAAQAGFAAAQDAQGEAGTLLIAARNTLEARRTEAGELTRCIASLSGQLLAIEQRLSDFDREGARLDADRSIAERLSLDAAQALARLDRTMHEGIAALAGEKARRVVLVGQRDEAERAEHGAEAALSRATATLAESEADLRIATAEVASLRVRRDGIARELAQARDGIAALLAEPDPAARAAQAGKDRADGADAVASAQTALDETQGDIATLRESHAASAINLAAARTEFAVIERERAALLRDREARTRQRAGAELSAINAVRAAPGYERALAAVLAPDGRAPVGEAKGDGRYWTGADVPVAVAESLLAHVPDCPAELRARLALVHAVETDDGRTLPPGQWLVTLAGRLRRWDGFVAQGEGAGEAAMLEAANRLADLDARLPGARSVALSAQAGHDRLGRSLDTAQSRATEAERALASAMERERAALRALDRAEDARDRHRDRLAELHVIEAELVPKAATAADELALAEARRDALPAAEAIRATHASAGRAHAAARAALQSAFAALSAHDQASARARERVAADRAEIRGWQGRADDAAHRIEATARRREEIGAEQAVLAAKIPALADEVAAARSAHGGLAKTMDETAVALSAAEARVRACDDMAAAASEVLATAREARAGAAARAEAEEQRRAELGRVCGERFRCPPPLLPERLGFAAAEVGAAPEQSSALDRLTADRERIGPVNLVAADELAEARRTAEASLAEQEELTEAVNRLRGAIGGLNREGRERLRAAFASVDEHFRDLFTRLFQGGQAQLALIDADDPLEAGLEIYAQPPGKRLQSLSLLSGGEQALTAVALIFALFLTNPAPICVLDEVDAPLDDANVDRFCDLLDAMVARTTTRYLIVTHNAVTMSRMHRLFGVTMIEKGVSRLVSVDLGGAEELLAAE